MTARGYPRPRWETPIPPEVRASWGPDVTEWARVNLGISLDRWQRRAVNRALAIDPATGRLLHRHYLISTARQNGKTAIVRALIGWALTAPEGPAWRLLLGLAHDKRQARIPYKAVRADLEPIARRLGPTARGGLNLTAYLGLRSAMYGRHREYDIASREAADAIRGLTVDLGLFDEVRTQRSDETWAALAPTVAAAPEPLIFGISTAGNDRSILLRDWFDRGRRIIAGTEPAEGFGMTWYAAPDELAPDDPRAWRAASPALVDGRLTPAAILAEYRSLTPATFRMERLNLWAAGGDEWLPAGLWAELVAPSPAPDTVERTILGVEVVPTWTRATVTVARATPDGVWVGTAGEIVSGRSVAGTLSPADLVELVERCVAQYRPDALAYSKSAAAAPHLDAMATAAELAKVPLGAAQIRQASELFRSELVGRRLRHDDDPLLASQVRDAQPSAPIESGSWYLSTPKSAGHIDAIRGAVWASWAAIAPEAAPEVLQIFT